MRGVWIVALIFMLPSISRSSVTRIKAASTETEATTPYTSTEPHGASDFEDEETEDDDDFQDDNVNSKDKLAKDEVECGIIWSPRLPCSQNETSCSIKEAMVGQHPWHGAVLKGSGRAYLCSGVLIRRNLVITTASCVARTSEDLWVRLGILDIRGKPQTSKYWSSPVEEIIIHPSFDEYTMQFDVAALVLEKAVDYSKYPNISPICIPDSDNDFSEMDCFTTGWHMSPVKEVRETIIDEWLNFDPAVALTPYTETKGFVVGERTGRISRRSYRRQLLEAPVRLTSKDLCLDGAIARDVGFLSQFLRPGQRCLGGYGKGAVCIPDVGSAVTCMSYQEGFRDLRSARGASISNQNSQKPSPVTSVWDAVTPADGMPCTPYPALRLEQMNREAQKKPSVGEDQKFYLAGVTFFVDGCDRDGSTLPDFAVITGYDVIRDFVNLMIP